MKTDPFDNLRINLPSSLEELKKIKELNINDFKNIKNIEKYIEKNLIKPLNFLHLNKDYTTHTFKISNYLNVELGISNISEKERNLSKDISIIFENWPEKTFKYLLNNNLEIVKDKWTYKNLSSDKVTKINEFFNNNPNIVKIEKINYTKYLVYVYLNSNDDIKIKKLFEKYPKLNFIQFIKDDINNLKYEIKYNNRYYSII